jgi:diguanylate cyclase (GGDEF)-like protein
MSHDRLEPTVNLGAASTSRGDASNVRVPCLRVLNGSFAGRLYRFTGAELTMGRAPDNDIVLETSGVSRNHARLTRGPDGGVLLTDLGSTNGTFVGGKAISSHNLRDGDQIGLATQVILRFCYLDMLEEQAEEQVYQRSALDGLTGCLSRRAYLERLATQYEAARARDLALSVVRIDADNFSRVGDSWGQPASDAVLVELARRFRQALGAGEWLGRLGGEEFSLLLPGCSLQSAYDRVEKIRREAETTPVRVPGNRELEITISAGLSALSPEHGAAWEALLKSADLALYQAKEAGRNRVVAFQSGSSPAPSAPSPAKSKPAPAVAPPAPAPAPPPPQPETEKPRPPQRKSSAGPAAEAETPRTSLTSRIRSGSSDGENRSPFARPAQPVASNVPPRPPLPQRRRTVRIPCQFAVSCLGSDRVRFPGVVKDMSLQGMRMEIPQQVEPGTLLAVVPSTSSPAVTVRVVWCRVTQTPGTYVAGAVYQISGAVLERSWVKQALQSIGFSRVPTEERRAPARVTVQLPASVQAEGKLGALPARTVNLGAGGCLVDCPEQLDPGQKIILTLGPLSDGQSVYGSAWVVHAQPHAGGHSGFRVGLMFETWESGQVGRLESLLRGLLGLPE